MKLLIDMNLSPRWVDYFSGQGVKAVHWSAAGSSNAPDSVLLDWASQNGYWIFMHDLDFGAILAARHQMGPSVIQARVEDVHPDRLGPDILLQLKQFDSVLHKGALISLDESRVRVRLLPLKPEDPAD